VIYANFASVYDRLMQDVPYDRWVANLEVIFGRFGITGKKVLDLGCGTGNVALPLAKKGYQVTALDLSPEMLALAEHKARDAGVKVAFICQDMREMDVPGEFDLVISMCDSMNYLLTDEEFRQVLTNAAGVLRDDGWLVFDLNSAYKIENLFGDKTYTLLDDDVAYVWENNYDPRKRVCHMLLTFFVRQANGLYERFTEEHRERAFSAEEVNQALEGAGFRPAGMLAEDTLESPVAGTERIYFAAQKTGSGHDGSK
jgi:SAM-dependent methyltransferase